jgi:hypothetical protein
MIDDSDDDAQPAQSGIQKLDEATFEEEEEELDPDEPYPSFIQQLDLPLSTEVLHIATPVVPVVSTLRSADSMPTIFSSKIVFSIACSDYSVRIITLPINPPSNASRIRPSNSQSRWGEQIIKITSHTGHQSIPKGVSLTWTSSAEPTFEEAEEEDMDVDVEDEPAATPRRKARRKQSRSRSAKRGDKDSWDLLLASHSAELGGLLRVWRFAIGDDDIADSIVAPHPMIAYQTVYLKSSVSKIAFNTALYPKRRHSQLLITDTSGIARIYDLFAPVNKRAGGSRFTAGNQETGVFTATFRTSFEGSKINTTTVPVLARRKPILDAGWASDGRCIIALLADGEWGIWDVDRSGPKPPLDPSAFSLRGFVGSSAQSSSSLGAASPKARSSRTSLAPMTPNTRRHKEENLFQGVSHGPSVPRGGVVISTLHSSLGHAPEDSVIIWYGNEVYRIPNMGQFWTRSASGSGGSLLGPGLSRIQALNLYGETITSVDQFDTTAKEARMAIPRNVLIAADHRLLIITSNKARMGQDIGAIFDKEKDEDELARRVDQNLLSKGELDLGGMDRLLNAMGEKDEAPKTTRFGLGHARKVLFASSDE